MVQWNDTLVAMLHGVTLRRLESPDSLEELTELLHRAYAPHAAAGLKFLATWQDVATTKERAESGECWVAVLEGHLVGTITVYPPGTKHSSPLFDRPGVASFGQFAVDPTLQLRGVGSALERLAERRAGEMGGTEMVIDTAEPAEVLRMRYERRGYRVIGVTQWNITNYRSVVLSKALSSDVGPRR